MNALIRSPCRPGRLVDPNGRPPPKALPHLRIQVCSLWTDQVADPARHTLCPLGVSGEVIFAHLQRTQGTRRAERHAATTLATQPLQDHLSLKVAEHLDSLAGRTSASPIENGLPPGDRLGERETEPAAFAHFGRNAKLSTVQIDHTLGDRQSQAGALGIHLFRRVCPVELFKDPGDILCRDTDSGVLDGSGDLFLVLLQIHRDPAPWRSVLYRIVNQVRQQVLQVFRRGADHSQRVWHLDREIHRLPLGANGLLGNQPLHELYELDRPHPALDL